MRHAVNRTISAGALVAVAALCAGCASTGYQQAERSTASMKDTRDLLTDARREVGVTMATLNQMVGQTEGDLVTQFQEYSRNLTAVQRSGQRIRSQVQTMRSRSEGFLSSWEQEMDSLSSEKARQQSEERRTQTVRQYEALVESMDQTRMATEPFMSNLLDIQSMLQRDLTWAGVDSVKGLVSKANTQAREVQARAAQVIRNLDSMAQVLGPPKQ